jgi:hypothetical protein
LVEGVAEAALLCADIGVDGGDAGIGVEEPGGEAVLVLLCPDTGVDSGDSTP